MSRSIVDRYQICRAGGICSRDYIAPIFRKLYTLLSLELHPNFRLLHTQTHNGSPHNDAGHSASAGIY